MSRLTHSVCVKGELDVVISTSRILQRCRARHAGVQHGDCVCEPDPGLSGDDYQLLQLHHCRILHGRCVLRRVYLRRRHHERLYRCLWQGDRIPRAVGTLARDKEKHNDIDFMLQVAFLFPNIGSGANEFFATIVSTNGNGQPRDLKFDNPFTTYTFTNQSGTFSFDFLVNDIRKLNKNHSAPLTGDIQNVVFTPTGVVDPPTDPTPVHEPATLLLFSFGLVVVARQFRRRRASK
jgi:hypothetical protein